MGFFDFLKKIIASKRLESMESDANRKEPLILEKDSLELGVAAGYTAHFIKQIEASLNRIEAQMPTKDWFALQFGENVVKKLDSIETNLALLLQRFSTLERTDKAKLADSEAKLTPKMKELIETVKKVKEISYEELARQLEISVPSLRGLLSETIRRANQMERFEKKNKGWVRYIGSSEEFQAIKSDSNRTESLLRENFENLVKKLGYTITQRYYSTPPDFILSKNGGKVAVKIEAKTDSVVLEKALGQLMYSKATFEPTELWLVVPGSVDEEWLKILEANGVKVFNLSDSGLREQKPSIGDQASNQLRLLFSEDS